MRQTTSQKALRVEILGGLCGSNHALFSLDLVFSKDSAHPTFPMSSAGACNTEFWREDGSSVSPGIQGLISNNDAELIEDCENIKIFSAFEISALAAQGSPKLTGLRLQSLINLKTNKVLINQESSEKMK